LLKSIIVEVKSRIDSPVDATVVDELLRKFPEFRRAYEPAGLSVAEFDTYGPTVRTLRQFSDACHSLERLVRDVVLPNPDAVLS
jgi:transaldolase